MHLLQPRAWQAAALYVTRNGKPALAGYFNSTLKKGHSKNTPCEMEALAIGLAIKHFSYYITQSENRTRILTDSRPCTLAFRKLMRGEEFSRRIFLLIYGNPSKSEAIYPKTKIFGEKKSIFENSSRGGPKNQNGRRFLAVASFLSVILKSMHLSKKAVITFFKEYKLG